MKYIVFVNMLIIGVPVMAMFAASSERLRGLLFSALIFSTVLGVRASINLYSIESYRGPDRGFEITLTDLIALALIIVLFIKHYSKIKWFPYNSLWLFAFFFFASLSIVSAEEKIFSAFTLVKLARLYVLYWCVVNCMKSGISRNYIWLGFTAIGIYLTFIAVYQKYLLGIYRIPGPFDHSNTIPAYVHLIIPAILIWGLYEKRFSPFKVLISLTASLGMAFAVVATQSRLGIALTFFYIVGILLFSNIRMRSAKSIGAAAAVILAISIGGIKASDSVIDRFFNAPEESIEARDEFNVAARKMSGERLLGVGLNNFSHALTNTEKYNEHIIIMAAEEQAGVVHHFYLLTAAETGYISLLIFVIIMLRFLWLSFRVGLTSKSLEGLLLIGFSLGFIALHLTGFLEWVLRITPVSYQFVITSAISVGIAEKIQSNRKKPSLAASIQLNQL